METLLFKDLGEMEYLTALSLQDRWVEKKQRGRSPDLVLVLEHPHVFTLGRGGKEANIISPGEVPVYRSGRGGDVTYHGPGQLVVYPLLDLRSRVRRDVHRYLRNIELIIIDTLHNFGLRAERKPPWTGVWIKNRKIASIGIAIRRGITCHGLALNVSTDLSYFSRIIPCGLDWAEMTSVQRELGHAVPMERVKERFLQNFVKKFAYTEQKELCHEDIQIGSRSEPQAARTTSA